MLVGSDRSQSGFDQDLQRHQTRQGRRLGFLDGARGLAAALVVLHHAYQSVPFWPELVRFSPLRIFLTGRPSVLFFYVLSGFVLSYGIWTSTTACGAWTYGAKRIVRIYLPYAATTLAACLLYWLMQPDTVAYLGDTFNPMWSAPITSTAMIQHLVLAGTPHANSLNVPAWSLVYELRISVFMPLLCALYMRAPHKVVSISIVAFLALQALFSKIGLSDTPYSGTTFAENSIITVYFVTLFLAGMVLARATIDEAPWMSASRGVRWILALAATSLVLVNRDLAMVPGVVVILYLCVTWVHASRFLGHPVLLFLGRISFSSYLIHMLVLETVLRQTAGVIPLFVSVPFSILLAVVIAWAFFIGVERPSHALSKRIGRTSVPRETASRSQPNRIRALSSTPPASTVSGPI